VGKGRIRVLIAKVGLDGHDRGAKFVARVLRDAGMEVIYTGTRQNVDGVVNTCIQEDIDVLGLSFLSGDHMTFLPKIIQGLKDRGRDDIGIVVGGTILQQQIPELVRMGIYKVFRSGTRPEEIVESIRDSPIHQEKRSMSK
jgi:methylmalonyl-CoA mutase C-terminal domain/subunit